jgi:hypothetical protein
MTQSPVRLLIDLGKKTLFGENKTGSYFCLIAENLIKGEQLLMIIIKHTKRTKKHSNGRFAA